MSTRGSQTQRRVKEEQEGHQEATREEEVEDLTIEEAKVKVRDMEETQAHTKGVDMNRTLTMASIKGMTGSQIIQG